jgi:VWFA-related protein
VPVPTLVKDANGKAIYGLQEQDFIIEDDGVQQPVHLDETAESEPISLVVAVQCGRRAKREFPRIRTLATMLDPVLNQPVTEAALLLFDSKLNLARDFTSNADLIEEDLKNLQSGDGGAAILDAVAYSAKLLNKRPQIGQRILLLISETRDHGSHFAKIDDVIKLTGITNTAVYAISFSPYLSEQLDVIRGANRDEWQAGVDILSKIIAARQAMRKNTPKTLAFMTSGEYELFASRKAFETNMSGFTNHLHSRYRLTFEPKDPHPGLHSIRVRLRDPAQNETVLFRSSYWASDLGK